MNSLQFKSRIENLSVIRIYDIDIDFAEGLPLGQLIVRQASGRQFFFASGC